MTSQEGIMNRVDYGIAALVALLTAAGCEHRPSTLTAPTGRSQPSQQPTSQQPKQVVATYNATLTASPSCADRLPEAARERTYTATLYADGVIAWTGPTLHPPPGHATISSGTLSEQSFVFSIDVERDPQSDDFHGIWDDMGGTGILNISGKGHGTLEDAHIAGRLAGVFGFWEGPNTNGSYCSAPDHGFTFVKQ
jgi:hypothetical protein